MSEQAPPGAGSGEIIGRMKAKIKELSRKLQEKSDSESALIKEVEGFRKGDQSGRVKELEGQLRTLKHRAAWDRLAKEAGVKPKALEAMYREGGYKGDADEPDEKAMASALEKLRDSHDYAFDADGEGEGDADGGGEPPARREREAAPDAGRGRRGDGKQLLITKQQLADPKFMLDPRNRERIRNSRVLE